MYEEEVTAEAPETYSEKMTRMGRLLIVAARNARLVPLEKVAETRLQSALYVAYNTGVADGIAAITEQVYYITSPVVGGITIEDDAVINKIFETSKTSKAKLKAAYRAGFEAGVERVSGQPLATCRL